MIIALRRHDLRDWRVGETITVTPTRDELGVYERAALLPGEVWLEANDRWIPVTFVSSHTFGGAKSFVVELREVPLATRPEARI